MSEGPTHQGISRRSFLMTTAAAAGAVAAGTSTVTALAGKEYEPAEGEKIVHSACRGNCGSRCPQNVYVREGKVVKVTSAKMPDEYFNANYRRICTRGYAQPQRVYDSDRVKYPMRRKDGTERGAGEWEKVSWDEAIAEIAAKMKAAINEYGGKSIGFWNSYACTGVINGDASTAYGRFKSRFGCTTLGPGADWAQMWFVYAHTPFYGNDIVDTPNAKTVLVWGANPTDAYPYDWKFVCDAMENGAKLIVIDPQYTNAAQHADKYYGIRPGTDGALALAMANYIIDNDLMDKEYMKFKTISPFLLKEDGTYLRTNEAVAPAAEGEEAAEGEAAAPATPTIMVWDNATGMAVSCNDAADPALEGEFEVNGIKVQTMFSFTKEKIKDMTVAKAAKICDMTEADIEEIAYTYATQGPVYIHTNQGLGHHVNSHHVYKNLFLISALTGNAGKPGATPLGHAAVGFGAYPVDTSCYVAGDAPQLSFCGMYLPDVVNTGKWGDTDLTMRVVWIHNGNPLCNESGRVELIEAIKKIDFVVTADTTLTDSALYSDIVLPVPHVYETDDFCTTCFTPYPPFQHKAIEPLYECKSDLEILTLVANAMGETDLYDKDALGYLRQIMDTPDNLARNAGFDAFQGDELVVNWALPAGTQIERFAGTVTGRHEYYLEHPFVRNNFGQEIAEYEKYPYYMDQNEAYWDNPLRAKYPLMGMSQHERYHVHSQLAFTPVLREIEPEPMAKINATDAAERGIKQGDYVRVYNDRGSCVLKAKVTEGIKPGVISMPHGWRVDQFKAGHSQDLTSRVMNTFVSNSSFYDYLCEVEKYEEA